jgi:hypothetical protein
MGLGRRVPRARCAAVAVTGTALAAAALAVLLPEAEAGRHALTSGRLASSSFPDLLVWGCAGVGVVATCWLWLVACLVVLDALRGVPTPRVGVPAALRRVVLVLCGMAVVSSLSGPAGAADSTPASDLPGALAGLRLPERVAVDPRPHDSRAQEPPATRVHEPRIITVQPGDTLWALAADLLGGDATDAQTAETWPAVYALNEDLIGDDPGRITPGQRLVLPALGHDGAAR